MTIVLPEIYNTLWSFPQTTSKAFSEPLWMRIGLAIRMIACPPLRTLSILMVMLFGVQRNKRLWFSHPQRWSIKFLHPVLLKCYGLKIYSVNFILHVCFLKFFVTTLVQLISLSILCSIPGWSTSIDYHFVCDHIAQGSFKVSHISSKDQLADALMKPLPFFTVHQFRSKISISNRNAVLWGMLEIAQSPLIRHHRLHKSRNLHNIRPLHLHEYLNLVDSNNLTNLINLSLLDFLLCWL